MNARSLWNRLTRLRNLLMIAFLCLVFAGVYILRDMYLYIPQGPFDRELWNADGSIQDSRDGPTVRQRMIRDLVHSVLPGKDRKAIESLLGRSPRPEEMKRHTLEDFQVREKDEFGNWRPFPRSGRGYYYDELDWDLIYPIGKERILVFDHRGIESSPNMEQLIIRLGEDGRFESWFIYGSTRWPDIVGDPGRQSYKRKR